MEENPKVSIIIPNYNDGDTLSTTLKAIQESDYQNVEVIVVDDASTDNSRDILRRFRINVLQHDRNRGQGAARNTGAQAARGSILFFTDGDVCIGRDTVRKVVDALKKDPDADAVVGLPDRRGVFRNMASIHFNRRIHYNYLKLPDYINVLYGTISAVKKNAFKDVGGFSENVTGVEDNEIGMRMVEAGKKIRHSKDIEVTHFKKIDIQSLLANDFRRTVDRVKLMMGRKMAAEVIRERRFITSPMYQLLSPFFAAGVTLFLLAGLLFAPLAAGAVAAGICFFALNGPYLAFIARDEGWWFAARLGALLVLDMNVVFAALVWGGAKALRGEVYS